MAKTFGNLFWNEFLVQLPLSIFRHMKTAGVTFSQFHQMEEDFKKSRNEIFGITWNNSFIRFKRDDSDELFKINIDREVNIWNSQDESLGCIKVDYDAPPTDEFIEKVEQLTFESINHQIRCSDCEKLMIRDQIAGRYFAGVYCKDCWESKWKAIEAQETYD